MRYRIKCLACVSVAPNFSVPANRVKNSWLDWQMNKNQMGKLIDFKTKETERRHRRIQELVQKALTDVLDEKEMQELRELTRKGCH